MGATPWACRSPRRWPSSKAGAVGCWSAQGSTTSAPRCSPSARRSTSPTWPGRPPSSVASGSTRPSRAMSVVDGGFESMRTLAPPEIGQGWEEYLDGDGWDWESELEALPDLLAEKCRAPSVAADRYDLVIDPTNLWLTIHESIGRHRARRGHGLRGRLRRDLVRHRRPAGYPPLQLARHARHRGPEQVPYGLATVAIDDEGVEASSFDLVRDGLLVGYQLDRAIAATAGFGRSNGCAFADSPLRAIQHTGQRLTTAGSR